MGLIKNKQTDSSTALSQSYNAR